MATSLADFQRRMAADVMRPLTADESTQPVLADGRRMDREAEQYIKPNSRLTALERLELYNRQYWFRVLGALQEDFPALQAVIGVGRFEALSVAYLEAHPSRSFTLRNLGSKMVAWLRANPSMAGRRAALAVDTAQVEWAYVEAFDGAERTPLTLPQIAELTEGSRISLQPHLQLLELEFPADDLVIAVHKGHVHSETASQTVVSIDRQRNFKVPAVRRRKTHLAVHRHDLEVYYRRLDGDEFAVLQSLRSGNSLGVALETGLAALRGNGNPEKRIAEWFHNWAEFGWLCEAGE